MDSKMNPQRRLLKLANNIGRRKTEWGRKKAIKRWCEQAKKVLSK